MTVTFLDIIISKFGLFSSAWFHPFTRMSTANTEALDLYDISVLLNYERGSTEPRFRHTKLREVTRTANFQTIRLLHRPDYNGERAGFVFDQVTPPSSAEEDRDLPWNMLSSPPRPSLQNLTPKQLETIFWQARGHDSCFNCVALVQHFFDLYPADVSVRVRTSDGVEYLTKASNRVILEMTLIRPRLMTISAVLPANKTYLTGSEPTMVHAVVGFGESQSGNISTVLDLASMQFGEVGRGLGGRSTFVLEDLDKYYDRIEKIAVSADTANAQISQRIRSTPNDVWLKEAAKRVKQRWEKREKEPWCGHCGVPAVGAKTFRCSKCHKAHYCNADHQKAAWPQHKHFCVAHGNA